MSSIFATATQEALPALLIEVTGMVTASNLTDYKARALQVIGAINRDPKTDNDFAVAENMVKWCKNTEASLADAKIAVQSQMKSVDSVFKVIDEIIAETRRARLELANSVTNRKDAIRDEVVADGIGLLNKHIESLNERLGKPYMPKIASDFYEAVKNKRTIDSLKAAMNAELQRAKGCADKTANAIAQNLETLRTLASDHKFLFADTATLVLKPSDELVTLAKARIAKHEEVETARIEADRERIRKEEAEKLQASAPAPVTPPVAPKAQPDAPAPEDCSPPTLRLGQIAERLGFPLTASFLQSLGFEAAGKDRAAVLYHERDFKRICAALVAHIAKVAK